MADNQGCVLSENDMVQFHTKVSKYTDGELKRLNEYFQSDVVYVIENVDLCSVLHELCYRHAITAQQAQPYKDLEKQCGSSTAASILVDDIFAQNRETVLLLWQSLFALQRNYSHPNLLGMLDEITENGYNLLKEELLNEHGHALQGESQVFQKQHKDHLFKQTNTLEEFKAPGQSQGPQSFPISERYVDLVVISDRRFRKQVHHEALEAGELHEIRLRRKVQTGLERITPNRLFRWCFRSHRMPQSVMVTGVAGVGKTTLMKKFVCEWVQGKHYQKFSFIFFFKFRDINSREENTQTSLEQLILQEYPYLKNHLGKILAEPQKLLFIFDGLDESRREVDLSSTGFQDLCISPGQVKNINVIVASLVKQTLLKSCSVLLTSRPIALEKLETGVIHRSTEIIGFLSKEREAYFSKFYDNEAISSQVFQYVRDTGILYTLCYNPSYCWITCTALRPCFTKQAGKPLSPPKTVTQLFVTYTSNVLTNHHAALDGGVQGDYTGIGWLADHGVKNRVFVFYDEDLKAFNVRASKLLSGFMMETFQNNDQSKVTRSFLHLTIQECWAAIVYYLDYSKERFRELIDRTNSCDDGRYEIFFRFLAGLSHPPSRSTLEAFFGRFSADATREVIKWLGEKVHQELLTLREDKDKRKLLNLFSFLFESHNSSLVREKVGQDSSLDFSDFFLTPVDCTILAYILGCCREIESLILDSCFIQTEGLEKLAPVLHSIKELSLNSNDLKDAGMATICYALRNPHCRIQILRLQSNLLTEESCDQLASAITENSTLLVLDMAKNKIRNYGLSKLLSIFDTPHCRIHTLSIQENSLSDEICQTLFNISNSGSLRDLDLRGNVFTDDCAGDMQYFILTCTSLTDIRLGMNDFTPQMEEKLSSLAKDRPQLNITM